VADFAILHIPMPRMTNTYMLNGEDTLEQMIASVDDGLYAVNFDGGQVDITSGKFVFSANEAYLIKNPQTPTPLSSFKSLATMEIFFSASSPDPMRVAPLTGWLILPLVANDLKLDSGVGVCGKDGQSVPVGVGQPSLKIDELTVGGTQVIHLPFSFFRQIFLSPCRFSSNLADIFSIKGENFI
jgi:TldD protein